MLKRELINTLAALKLGRDFLVADYCNEEPRLFRPMFLHKSNSSEMNIAVDRYMFGWLALHPSHYESVINKDAAELLPASAEEVNRFVETYRSLCERFVVGETPSSEGKSHVLERVVKESIGYLDGLLSVSEKTDARLERLRYQGEKSKHLFDRAVKELKEGSDGIF